MHVNIRSTGKNFYFLKILINSFSSEPDIIAVTETWLSDNALFLYELEGYRSYHVVRTAREHGAVSNDVHNNHQSELILSFVNNTIEICSVKVKLSNYTLTVSAIYRPH